MSKHKKSKLKLRYKILFWLCLIVTFFCLYITKIVNPLIFSLNKAQLENESILAINMAISSTLTDNLYDNLIEIEKNDVGEIVLISCNSANVNNLTNNIIMNCQQNLKTLGEQGFDVTLLTFTGLTFLNGLGPKVNIQMQPLGYCNCTYSSEFISSGINQTLHQIYISAKAKICALMPINSFNFEVVVKVLVAESVVVGAIPQMYLNGSLLGNKLNLVP